VVLPQGQFIVVNPKNAVAFFGKRNPLIKTFRGRLWPNAASGAPIAEQWVGLSKYSHTLRGMRRFCPAIFSLSPDRSLQGQALAQILRLTRKIKTKCIFQDKSQ